MLYITIRMLKLIMFKSLDNGKNTGVLKYGRDYYLPDR